MIIYAIDDEAPALRLLTKAILAAAPGAQLKTFSDPHELLDAAADKPCDIAFLDIHLPGISGLDLARALNESNAASNIIFVTGYDQYAKEAFDLFASGYVAKPVRAADIAEQLQHLRVPVSFAKRTIYVQTFGNFEVFVDDEPVRFSRSRSKEVLAYLVDKQGTGVTNPELAAAIWENDPYDDKHHKYMHVLVAGMRKDLEEAGAGALVRKTSSELAVNTDACECDLYQLLDGDPKVRERFAGQYMNRYSWAELTKAHLASRFL